jgi:hypothetical protein
MRIALQDKIVRTLCAVILLMTLSGCGPSMGAWLYTLGMVPKQKSNAEFKIPEGPVMILVDDEQDLVDPPLARDALVTLLAQQLKDHKIADHITTNEEVTKLRKSEPNFEQRGARELGRLAGVHTVLWLSIKQFTVEKDLEIAVAPAQFAATLKVVNALAEKRDEVRLWPLDREGTLIAVKVAPQDLHTCKSKAEVHEKMADAMADKVAKLFYDYETEK